MKKEDLVLLENVVLFLRSGVKNPLQSPDLSAMIEQMNGSPNPLLLFSASFLSSAKNKQFGATVVSFVLQEVIEILKKI